VSTWRLGFTTGAAPHPRERQVPAGEVHTVLGEIGRAKQRFGLPEQTRVVSCYEAGRDGFWLHRFLVAHGVENLVVDSASMEVNRRQRRAKTDRLDMHKLLTMLWRHLAGETRVWSVVRVPSVDDEDRRQLHRALVTTKRDRTRVINRIKGVLAGDGIRLTLQADVPAQVGTLQQWDGTPLPPALRARLEREWQKVGLLTEHIAALEAERRMRLRTSTVPAVEKVRQLHRLRGIGLKSAWLSVMEFFAWRDLRTAKQVGALAGLTPTPPQSGQASRELGITKAGNGYMRTMAIEIAWGWLRFQPDSAFAQWYQTRFGRGSSRIRRIGSVALARQLLIARWRFVETGVVPAGAVLKGVKPVEEERKRLPGRLSWYGPLVAGHGFARQTDEEEERSATGLHRRLERRQDGVVGPPRSTRREGRSGPASPADHEATRRYRQPRRLRRGFREQRDVSR
jgi:transposase